jgi:phage replication-related protein YjqB (UPF0714/DUF867 family)
MCFKVFVGGRLEAVETDVSKLKQEQISQNENWLKVQHNIEMHLFSLDMNVSNALDILRDHKLSLQKLGDGRTY